MGSWTRERTWPITRRLWIAGTTCLGLCGERADCLCILGAKARKSSGWRWILTTTIDFGPAILWLWVSNLGRWGFRGITGCTGGENRRSVNRFAVDQQGELHFEEVAVLTEAKFHQFHGTEIPRFPVWSFEWLLGLVG